MTRLEAGHRDGPGERGRPVAVTDLARVVDVHGDLVDVGHDDAGIEPEEERGAELGGA